MAPEHNNALIYVPEDDPRFCREAGRADIDGAQRIDALAARPRAPAGNTDGSSSELGTELGAEFDGPGGPGHRSGLCHCCRICPRNWSYAEQYSEHYRCADRTGLRVTHRAADLGIVTVGSALDHPPGPNAGAAPARPPVLGRRLAARRGSPKKKKEEVRFDLHRDETYKVEFVAVSTAAWQDNSVGLVRLKITFVVEGNVPPPGFDEGIFEQQQQQQARAAGNSVLRSLCDVWERWERQQLGNRDTVDQMCAQLGQLRELLERHPRLDGGY